MNERIKELAAQCRESHLSNTGEWYCEFDEDKFAELIILECIVVLDEDDGATHHTELLKKHFGVK